MNIGLHSGADNSTSQYSDFSNWLGKSVTHRVTFAASTLWTDIASPYFLNLSTVPWLAADPSHAEVLTVALVPTGDSNNTLAAVAAGTNDSYWQTLATKLYNTGYSGQIIIRLGWELNGNWYVWAVNSGTNTPAQYAAAYSHVVTVMKAIAPNLRFEWNLSLTGQAVSGGLIAAYPGDSYVDIISMDVYDAYNNGWNHIVNGGLNGSLNIPYGLNAFRSFAQAHSKPEAYTEWSCDTTVNGHGDDPLFAAMMYAWMAAGNVSHQGYWNTSSGGPNAAIQGASAGNVPRAAQMYQLLFGRAINVMTIPAVLQGSKLVPASSIPSFLVSVCDGANYTVQSKG